MATKEAAEVVLDYYTRARPIRGISLSLPAIDGPDDPRGKFISALLRAHASGTTLEMSPVLQLLDLVFADDVVQGFLRASALALPPLVHRHLRFSLSSGDPIPLRDLVRVLESVLGSPMPIEWGAQSYRDREIIVPWPAHELLPGWVPKVRLQDGLARVVHAGTGG